MNFVFPYSEKNVETTDFQGSAYFNVIGMYFLNHKHKNVCVVLPHNYNTDPSKNIYWFEDQTNNHTHDKSCVLLPEKMSHFPENQTEVSLRWIEKKGKLRGKKNVIDTDGNPYGHISVPKNFWENFNKCDKKRFVVFPFGFSCVDSGHANYMIYDKILNTLERFEPFGRVNTRCLNAPILDKSIEKLFRENLKNKDFTYLPPLHFLPSNNFQTIQENEKQMNRRRDPVGFCSVWSIFWIDLRLSNPDIPNDILAKLALDKLKTLKKNGVSFTRFIRNYSNVIVEASNGVKTLYKLSKNFSPNTKISAKNNISVAVFDGRKRRSISKTKRRIKSRKSKSKRRKNKSVKRKENINK